MCNMSVLSIQTHACYLHVMEDATIDSRGEGGRNGNARIHNMFHPCHGHAHFMSAVCSYRSPTQWPVSPKKQFVVSVLWQLVRYEEA